MWHRRRRSGIRSALRHDPAGGRQGEVGGADQRVGVAIALHEAAPGAFGQVGIPVGQGGPLGVEALDRRVHHIAREDRPLPLRGEADRDVIRRVAGRRLKGDLVVEREVVGHQLRLPGGDHRQDAVLEQGARENFSWPPCQASSCSREHVARLGKGRHPATAHPPGVPADVVGVEMGAHHVVDVLRRHPERGERPQIRVVSPRAKRAVRALLSLPTQASIRMLWCRVRTT